MSSGNRRKITKSQVLVMPKKMLDAIRDGKLDVGRCKSKLKNGVLHKGCLKPENKQKIFGKAVLNVPLEIDYILGQTAEGMGYNPTDVKVGFYEDSINIKFEIFPPESA